MRGGRLHYWQNMNFLEKNLEAIIFKEMEYCRERGLSLEPYDHITYRQLNLTPYGIADLVQIGRDRYDDILRVRVIECKRNIVDAATYAQAARYQVAISRVLDCCVSEYSFEKVLIGQRVDKRNDFWAIVSADERCGVYTYEYRSDGIHFKRHHNRSEFGYADAGDIYRPTTNEIFRVVAQIMPEQEDEA